MIKFFHHLFPRLLCASAFVAASLISQPVAAQSADPQGFIEEGATFTLKKGQKIEKTGTDGSPNPAVGTGRKNVTIIIEGDIETNSEGENAKSVGIYGEGSAGGGPFFYGADGGGTDSEGLRIIVRGSVVAKGNGNPIETRGTNTKIHNYGRIESQVATAITAYGAGSEVINYGNILSRGRTNHGIFENAAAGDGATPTKITNWGTIRTLGDFSNGIVSRRNSALIQNFGSIIANGGAISVKGDGTKVTNAGLLQSTSKCGRAVNFGASAGSVNSNAICRFTGDEGTVDRSQELELLPGSRIIGHVRFGGKAQGGNDVLSFVRNGRGFNSMSLDVIDEFKLEKPADLVVVEANITGADRKSYVDRGYTNDNLVLKRVAVFDPASSSQALRAASLVDTSDQIFSAVSQRLNSTGPLASLQDTRQVAAHHMSGSMMSSTGSAWAKGLGSYGYRKARDFKPSSRHHFGGFAIGGDHLIRPNFLVGIYGGMLYGKQEIGTNYEDIDTRSAFFGTYGRLEARSVMLDLDVGFAYNWSDRERHVAAASGTEIAKADSKGYLVSVGSGLARRFVVGQNSFFTPAVRLRYIGGFDNSYTETGSKANLSVDSHSVHVVETRLEGSYLRGFKTRTGGDGFLRATLGGLYRTSFGGKTFSGSLLGQKFSVRIADSDRREVGGVAAAGFGVPVSDRWSIFGNFEGTILRDADYDVGGEVGLRYKL